MQYRRKRYHQSKKYRRRTRRKISIVVILCVLAVAAGIFYKSNFIPNYKETEIPYSLLEFAAKYPEANWFVSNYPRDGGREYDMDVSKEVKNGEIPLFIQWDKRWGYKSYGDDYFAVTGCGPACMSMIVCGLTGDTRWNPYEMGCFSDGQGYYTDGVGTSWSLMTEGAEQFGLTASYGTVSEEYILENLGESTPMICSMGPGDFTYTGHFIVLTGIDRNGKIIVNDPNSKINSKKHWEVSKLVPQIKSLWSYSYD
ncbi:MAG: C39 family peptidase [Clostridiales bacterium]|nr:C39 family peptidase [Clostridiales bacterium]